MSATNQTAVTLVGAGGSPPYTFLVVAGPNTTCPATLVGNIMTVDATSLTKGTYSVEVQITDLSGSQSIKTFTIDVIDSTVFTILNRDLDFLPSSLPSSNSVTLQSVGGSGTITWSLLPQVTSLPGASVSGNILNFTLTSLGNWEVGVRATDMVGNTVTRLLKVTVSSSNAVSLADGQARIQVAASSSEVGAHQFTIAVTDSASNTVHSSFNYLVDNIISGVDLEETVVTHAWGSADTATVVIPISGDLTGLGVGSSTAVVAPNGLTATIDTATNAVVVSGPPTSFENSEIQLAVALVKGTTQVATITREFTLVSTNAGTMTCNTRPYIVGDIVGLNPQRPYYNSPSLFKNVTYTVRVAANSALPSGLSLDSVTGLVYGSVLAADVAQSTLQYLDTTGKVAATITVNWDIVVSQFQLIDTFTDGQLQAPYTGTLTASSTALLTSASPHRGNLPSGMSFSITGGGTEVTLSGTPTEAGFYDIWIAVGDANAQTAYLHKRLVIDYITPLLITTDYLAPVQDGFAYSQTIHATGGVQPYAWSVVGGVLPTGITLDPASGLLTGTTSDTPYNQDITFAVTDARGVIATAAVALVVDNTLTITTPILPVVTAGVNYSFQIQAVGGQGTYTWYLGGGSAALPGGLTLSSTGVLSGATSLVSFSENIIVRVTDSANNATTHTFALVIGSAFGLLIDTEGVGPIVRGSAYIGRLSVLGNGLSPYAWKVASDSPNPLPAGLALSSDASNSGATATLSGKTTATLLNESVKIQVIDANGNLADAFLFLNTYSSLTITTASLPQATVSGSYDVQLTATGVNNPFVWSLDPSSPALPSGVSLTSLGLLSGVPTAASNQNLVLRVTDSINDFTAKSFSFVALASTLAITTVSLPAVNAGMAYGGVLAATGGSPAYTWSVSPNSASLLPAGLTLTASTGAIVGTTLQVGFSKRITFRVTDSVNVYREVTLLVTVVAAIQLKTGPDYALGSTFNYLGVISDGDVTGIYPRPNMSFYVVATKFISTSPSGFLFGLPAGFSASVVSMANGVAIFAITGPFSSGVSGVNNFAFSISDSGVNASAKFYWAVFPQPQIALGPKIGSLPILFT